MRYNRPPERSGGMSIQSAAPFEMGLVASASRAELKAGNAPIIRPVFCSSDMVMAVCRAIAECKGGYNDD